MDRQRQEATEYVDLNKLSLAIPQCKLFICQVCVQVETVQIFLRFRWSAGN